MYRRPEPIDNVVISIRLLDLLGRELEAELLRYLKWKAARYLMRHAT
jgi:hypothetical protein